MSIELIKRILSSLILIPIIIYVIIKGSTIFILFLFLCFFILSYEWSMMIKNEFLKILGIIFLIISLFSIYKIRINPQDSYSFLLLITIVCISTDIGGYIFGKFFGGPKLTKLSPNKTYAGMIGSYILALCSSIFFLQLNFVELNHTRLILFTLIISTVSQLGDIFISYFKRKSKVKDTGKIIPGHGGLLDRADGMIFAFPISYLIMLTELI